MLEFLAANLSTILISIVLLAIVVLISIHLVREKKRGQSSCGCGALTVRCTAAATALSRKRGDAAFTSLHLPHF